MDNKVRIAIHRTNSQPFFVNFLYKENGLPKFLTSEEFDDYYNRADNNVKHELNGMIPLNFYGKQEEGILRAMQRSGISIEEMQAVQQKNINERLSNFFQKGLFCLSNSIDGTVTFVCNEDDASYEEQTRRMNKLVSHYGAGFNSKTPFRDNMEIVLILEMPIESVNPENKIQMLFERSNSPLEIGTTYHGVHKIYRIVPPQYIKGAYIYDAEKNKVFVKNEKFDKNYIVKDGEYEFDAPYHFVRKKLANISNIDQLKDFAIEVSKIFTKTKNLDFLQISIEKIQQYASDKNINCDDLVSILNLELEKEKELRLTSADKAFNKLKNSSTNKEIADNYYFCIQLMRKDLNIRENANFYKDVNEFMLSLLDYDISNAIYYFGESQYGNEIILELNKAQRILQGEKNAFDKYLAAETYDILPDGREEINHELDQKELEVYFNKLSLLKFAQTESYDTAIKICDLIEKKSPILYEDFTNVDLSKLVSNYINEGEEVQK